MVTFKKSEVELYEKIIQSSGSASLFIKDVLTAYFNSLPEDQYKPKRRL
jgi:hypothetical protein